MAINYLNRLCIFLLLPLLMPGCTGSLVSQSPPTYEVAFEAELQHLPEEWQSGDELYLSVYSQNVQNPLQVLSGKFYDHTVRFVTTLPAGTIRYTLHRKDSEGKVILLWQGTTHIEGTGVSPIHKDTGTRPFHGFVEIKHPWNQRPAASTPVQGQSTCPISQLPVFDDPIEDGELGQIVRYTDREQTLNILQKTGYTILDELEPLQAFLAKPPRQHTIHSHTTLPYPGSIETNIPATASFISHRACPVATSPALASIDPEVRQPMIAELRTVLPADAGIEPVAPDDPLYGGTPYLPDRAQRPYMEMQMLPLAWNLQKGSSSIRVAVLDTGVDYFNPDLVGKIDQSQGISFVHEPDQFLDHNGHGSHVAGIIGAETNNGLGTAGVMWDVTILPVQVLNEQARGTAWQVAKGLLYASGQLSEYPIESVDIINLSLTLQGSSNLVEDAVRLAAEAGVLMVAAAGNDAGPVAAPASYQEVIAVGALDICSLVGPRPADFSNFGGGSGSIDFIAPGVAVDGPFQYHRFPRSPSYAIMTGTSMAAPFVTGALGLLLAAGHSSVDAVERLRRTASPLAQDAWLSPNPSPAKQSSDYYPAEQVGFGMPNVYWALTDPQQIEIFLLQQLPDGGVRVAAHTQVHLARQQDLMYHFSDLRLGTYYVAAWIDVDESGGVGSGDYFGMAGPWQNTEGSLTVGAPRLTMELLVGP